MPNIPEIRFNGYTDDWEQRKLREIAIKVTEKNKNNMFSEPFTNSAELGIISQKDYFDREIVNEDNLNGYYIVHDNDFVYNPRVSAAAPVGPINRNKLGRTGVMSPLYTVFRTHDISMLYLEYYYKTTSWHNFMKMNGDSGARFDRFTIGISQFMEMPIPYPDFEEQVKIGRYFSTLDTLVTFHQRKCDEIKELKKYMLQNMFPQKGEKVPRIRFNGYTDDWEQRKLGELGSLKNGMNFSKDAMGHGYAFVNLQNIFENNVVDGKSLGLAEASEKQLLEYSLQIGDVLFVRSSVKLEGVGEAALVAEPLEHTTYSGFIIRFRDEYGLNNDFKKFVFATKKVRNQIMSQATNSANKNINQSVLENLTLEIPSKDEQKQIGEYFSTLDNLITLHQRKCDELKELKKYMLQKMFPKEK
ncbi:MAG: restriction endonuclease subunit S [Oliverpabstia sp.]